MTSGIVARLRSPLERQTDMSDLLTRDWGSLPVKEFGARRIRVAGRGPVPLDELFELTGTPANEIRFEGDLSSARRLGAGLTEGTVTIDGSVGADVGLAMAGGSIDVRGDAGANAGGAAPEGRRGMTGGELIIRRSAAEGCGTRMRRGLIAVGGDTGPYAGLGMLAGTVVVFGSAGDHAGLWSKRGSIVALGPVTVPSTYRYACTYRPDYLRLLLGRLRRRYGLAAEQHHLSGAYRRFSGDLADLGKGEILAWTAQ
jgi:formylmethanofuran dehydrogenase subunit C